MLKNGGMNKKNVSIHGSFFNIEGIGNELEKLNVTKPKKKDKKCNVPNCVGNLL